MDHIENLKLAVRQWWTNKYLWIFGIIVTFFTNTNSSNLDREDENGQKVSTFSEAGFEKVQDGFQSFTSQTDPAVLAILIGIIVIIGLLFIAGAIYLGGKAKTALIMEGTKIYKNDSRERGFKAAWNATGDHWIRLFVMNIISALIVAVPVAILIGLVFVIIFAAGGDSNSLASLGLALICVLVCIAIIPIIILGISISVIKEIASREIVLNGVGGWDSLKIAYNNFKSVWKEYVLGLIVFMIPSVAYTIVLFIALVPLMIISGILILLTETMDTTSLLYILINLAVQIFVMIFVSILGGPLTSLHAQYWNILYDKLKFTKSEINIGDEVIVA